MKKKDFVGKMVETRTVDSVGRVNTNYRPIKKVKGDMLIDNDGFEICNLNDIDTEISKDNLTYYYSII